mmetsp:Transcript_111652/g.197073  ORF Transcript_111652/g.197073 Transcript_111652/m.197073 type:complete len:103 (-) Transcript_111652:25-333(-)
MSFTENSTEPSSFFPTLVVGGKYPAVEMSRADFCTAASATKLPESRSATAAGKVSNRAPRKKQTMKALSDEESLTIMQLTPSAAKHTWTEAADTAEDLIDLE